MATIRMIAIQQRAQINGQNGWPPTNGRSATVPPLARPKRITVAIQPAREIGLKLNPKLSGLRRNQYFLSLMPGSIEAFPRSCATPIRTRGPRT